MRVGEKPARDRAATLTVPRSVAVVGASPPEGGSYYGSRLIANLVAANPAADIYPVNPRLAGGEILGHKVYARLDDLPAVPDMVVVGIGAGAVPAVLREAGALGVRSAVVITAHLGAEADRRAFDHELATIAAEHDMLVIGPNSVGVLNGNASINASFATGADGGALRPGDVAVVGQSGAVISYLLQAFRDRALGYSWLISTGNEAAQPMEGLFDLVVDDPDTNVILLFVEGSADGPRFRRAALRARAAGKAVVMLNAGRSEAGRHAVQSHTGRIAGTAAVMEAVAAESGILVVSSYQEMFDAALALSTQSVRRAAEPHGRRAAVLTTSGGNGTVTADWLSAQGWTLPPLPDGVRAELEEICGQDGLGNPVDVTGAFAQQDRLARMSLALAKDPTLDAIFIASGAGGPRSEGMTVKLAEVRPRIAQEMYVGWVGLDPASRVHLDRAGIAAYDEPARAVAAAEAGARIRNAQIDPDLPALLDAPLRRPGTPEVRTAGAALTELAEAGVSVVPMALTETLDGADAHADRLGYPVAVKLDAPDLNHKTESGGVILGLADAAAVREATARLRDIAERQGLTDARVLVQRMVRGVEVLVGLKYDDAFGLMLVLGVGGTRAELHTDAVGVLLPTTRAQLSRRLADHRVLGELLAGYRGDPPADREALLDVVEALARWAIGHAGVVLEADLNPVVVTPDGAFVVDARAVIA
ncbi:acetate--CoA ligase family protein [Phytohabitans kaempferiae]|uniref:Acetate--CoA ligase family protein n=1 Tax=Phytohabitans kaempferiae TaxID=1620943 RepID=A0ABV6MH28_9ACTN